MHQSDQEILYKEAKKRVEKLKGFYIHVAVYLVVNFMIIYANYTYSNTSTSIFEWRNFGTAFWWGIGLLAHAFSIFTVDYFFGKEWEERKIQELMNKERENNDFV